jgi:NDP-sugar pyrophosphorylase family protein
MKINILIPMAGLGKRFEKTHPNIPKPFITIQNRSMLSRVIENLKNHIVEFIFVSQETLFNDSRFEEIIKNENINYKTVIAPSHTDGPACSCLLAKNFIDNNDPLIIVNCDQMILDFNLDNLLKFAFYNKADGVLGVFHSTSSKNSYIKLGDDLRIQEIKEKIVISNIATNGLHFWKHGKFFVESAEKMISSNDRYSNEFYVAPSYNYLIKEGKNILPYYYNLHYPIGIPEDLNYFTTNIL